jgi:peptidoglycan L-alanyl-D-glutamate endopeptidase CwlK
MSRKLEDLDVRFQHLAEKVLELSKQRGAHLLVTCTRRTMEEQGILYAQGRSKPGKIVTRAKPGRSAHNFGLAMDVVPLVDGKPDWALTNKDWAIYGQACAEVGVDWAGKWPKFKEYPHCQLRNWIAFK